MEGLDSSFDLQFNQRFICLSLFLSLITKILLWFSMNKTQQYFTSFATFFL